MSDILLVESDGPIQVLTLNEPRRANPLSPEMATALTNALKSAEADDRVRAVVLTGAGRHFSAGADLAALKQIAEGGSLEENLNDSRRLQQLFSCLLDHPKLTIAAVHGAAVAGGCGLATGCDFVVADEGARFCYSEVKIGFIPALVSTYLTRRVAGHVARRLLLDPEMLDAKRAQAVGLVDEVVPVGTSLERATSLARSVCTKASPSALAATKRLLNRTVGMDWRQAMDVAAEANAGQRLEDECRRGVQCFLKTKGTPDWIDGTDG